MKDIAFKGLAGNNKTLKEVANFTEKFSSSIDNLAYLDEQEALMKAFRTDAKIAEEKAAKVGLEKGEKLGVKKGEKIGLEKGETKKAMEVAKNLLTMTPKMKLEDIAQATGLTVKEIENLR